MMQIQLIISTLFFILYSNVSISVNYIENNSCEIKSESTVLSDSLETDKEKEKQKKTPSGRIVGLKIGGGTASITDFDQFQSHKGAFYVGLSKEFLLTKTIGISVEGNYWLTGFTNDTTLTKVSFNYISVPVMLNINIGKFYFATGMYAGLNLRTSERISNNARTYYGFQNNKYELFDWGAVFNIGFKWRFLGFDVRYVLGLQDVLKYTQEKQYNSVLFFGASLHLMKKKK